MDRTLLKNLVVWKESKTRKPLLIDGARRTGKTFLLEELLGKSFENVLRIDFLENPEFIKAFAGSLNPDEIITNIELLTGKVFDLSTDLLILDEIGECPRAMTALKYFAENTPNAYVAACGSHIDQLTSFPVGKVEQYELRPLTFKEFLWASEQKALQKAYEQQLNSAAVHTKLLELLTDYYVVGGMPEAVNSWFENSELSIIERLEAVSEIHRNLIEGYMRDFGKYCGKIDSRLIESVFRNVPAQLSSVHDDSVKRFRFKGVHEHKSRYAEYESAISWLHKCKLILKNHQIDGQPRAPLSAHKKENIIKLFLFDVGLLNHMLDTSYRKMKLQSYDSKGYLAENYVQQELAAMGCEPCYSWRDARAEIEFIMADDLGRIIPVEVKSGKRTQAKSLQSYIEKCSPHKTIKLTGTQGSPATETKHIVMPLYYTEYLSKHLRSDKA